MAELTVEEKLRALFALQSVDSKIDEIQILKGELPMEVEDLEDEIEGLKTRIGKAEDALAEANADILAHSTNIKEAEALIQKYEKQQDNVKNNREYEALIKEIEIQRLEIQLSEKRSREGKAKLSGKEDAVTASKERLDEKNKNLEYKKVELDKIIKDTEKAEKNLLKASDKSRKTIENRLLKAYDKVRKAYRNGLAVVSVERNSCGGCYNEIPAQVQLEIGQRKKIMACEHCGRVLVDNEIAGIEPPVEEPKTKTKTKRKAKAKAKK